MAMTAPSEDPVPGTPGPPVPPMQLILGKTLERGWLFRLRRVGESGGLRWIATV